MSVKFDTNLETCTFMEEMCIYTLFHVSPDMRVFSYNNKNIIGPINITKYKYIVSGFSLYIN